MKFCLEWLSETQITLQPFTLNKNTRPDVLRGYAPDIPQNECEHGHQTNTQFLYHTAEVDITNVCWHEQLCINFGLHVEPLMAMQMEKVCTFVRWWFNCGWSVLPKNCYKTTAVLCDQLNCHSEWEITEAVLSASLPYSNSPCPSRPVSYFPLWKHVELFLGVKMPT